MHHPPPLLVTVVIASKDRPSELANTAHYLSRQTLRPHAIFFSVSSSKDIPPQERCESPIHILYGSPGLPRQRNRALDEIPTETDVVFFMDDDYLPTCNTIEDIAAFFKTFPDVVGIDGKVLADGINTPEISLERAVEIVLEFESISSRPPLKIFHCAFKRCAGLYGCNMAFRYSAIKDLRFDERLPFYAWQEDSDFSFRAGERGQILKTNAFFGVHRGVKNGRSQGDRLGYSQIANPIYLKRKGTMSRRVAYTLIIRNLLANHVRALFPESWIDRWGRVRGNWLALSDWMHRRLDPERILHF